tara:strand:+ start:9093 stop:9542 length:450 start_codon:yes stop_codon:yes gene_type:complete
LNLEAGDIIASQGTKLTSRVIQFMTRSHWGHVGIVTPQEEILEATTVKKGNLEDKPVRTVGLNQFRKDTAKIIVFRRKTPMTDIQREEFDKAATKSALRTYAKEQAFFSNGLPTIKFLLALYFGIPCIEIILYLMMNNSQGGVLTIVLQ